MTCILAIDPGISGALAFYYPARPNLIAVYDMPVYGGDVNSNEIYRLIEMCKPSEAIIEQASPHPKEGVVSVWRYAAAFTTARVAVHLSNVPLLRVSPTQWKKAMNLAGGKEGKTQARLRASEQFPLSAERFARVKDHGRAEAALLAVYAATRLKAGSDGNRLPAPLAQQS
jgi:hypothetical protein